MAGEKWEEYREGAIKVIGPWQNRTLVDHVMFGGEGIGGRPIGLKLSGSRDVVVREHVTGEPCVIVHNADAQLGDLGEHHTLESPLGDGKF